MAAIASGFNDRHLEFRYSADVGNVDRVTSESGMSENMGVEVEIAAISHRSKLISISSLVVALLNSGIT